MTRSRLETPALVGLGILSMATNVMVPILVDTLIERLGLSRVDAGKITSFEFLGALAGSVLVLTLIGRIDRRSLACFGIPVWIACNALSAIYPTVEALPYLRAGSGLGMGISLAIAMGAIASRPNPVRLFAGLMVGVPLFLMLAIPALQTTVDRWGVAGAYMFLGFMAAIALVAATWLPSAVPQTHGGDADGQGWGRFRSLPVALLIAAVLLLFIGFNGAWAYVSQVGRAIDLSPQTVAWIIGIAQLASIAGSFLAGVLNERLGHVMPLAFAVALAVGGSVLLTASTSLTMFSASLVPLLFGWLMAQPFIMGVSAKLDPSGVIATGVNVVQNLGTAAGPYLAARVIEGQPVGQIGHFAAILFGIGLVLIMPSALRAGRPSKT